MRRTNTTFSVIVGTIAVVTVAGCGDQEPKGWNNSRVDAVGIETDSRALRGQRPSVAGVGEWSLADGNKRTFSVFARQRRNGSVRGFFTSNNRSQGIRLFVDVDCLEVVGDTAVASGVVTFTHPADATDPNGNMVLGQTRFAAFEDNRGPHGDDDDGHEDGSPTIPDRATLSFDFGAASSDACRLVGLPPASFLIDLERGGVRVRP